MRTRRNMVIAGVLLIGCQAPVDESGRLNDKVDREVGSEEAMTEMSGGEGDDLPGLEGMTP